MATRCNVRLIHGDSDVWIYRHWDGYPSETGADIARKLKGVTTLQPAVLALLTADAEGGVRGGPRCWYELTIGMHGDIEHLYTVRFEEDLNSSPPSFEHHTCAISAGSPSPVLRFRGGYADFVDYLNKEIRDVNARMRIYCQENGSEFTPDPMLEA